MLRRIGLVNGLRGRDCPGRGGFCPDGLYRVSPGFEFADYQRADRDQLIRLYPDMDDLIIRLT